MSVPFAIIVAIDQNNGMGKNGLLPWSLPGEIKHFKDVTTHSYTDAPNVVIMGRKTWESIPEKFRPLSKRLNIVVSRNHNYSLPEGVLIAGSLDEALNILAAGVKRFPYGKVFVIGGAQLFNEAIVHPFCQELFLTRLKASFECDCFFPPIPTAFKQVDVSSLICENSVSYQFIHFCK